MSEAPAVDAQVAAEFGVGEPTTNDNGQGQQDQQDQQAQVADETAFEDLPSPWQEEIKRLRR